MPQYQPHERFTETDRDKVAGRLKDAYGDGRLDSGEFNQRLDKLYDSHTYGELEPLVSDLPAPATYNSTPAVGGDNAAQPGQFEERAPQQRSANPLAAVFGGFGGVVMICILIWVITGVSNGGHFAHFWPVWMLIPWAFILMGALRRRAEGLPDRDRSDRDRRRELRDRRRGY